MNQLSLQEIIARGRYLFSGAPKRFQVFKMINDKRTGKDIARKVGRSQSSVLQDIQKMKDFGLILSRRDDDGNLVKEEGSVVFEKNSIVKHISNSHFEPIANVKSLNKESIGKKTYKSKTSKKFMFQMKRKF